MSLLASGGAAALLRMAAEKAPDAGPGIRVGVNVVRAMAGLPRVTGIVGRRSKRFDDHVPLLGIPDRRRISRREEALRLQLAYHTLTHDYLEYGGFSRRVDLLDEPWHEGCSGQRCMVVTGLVSRLYGDGVSKARICLTAPSATALSLRMMPGIRRVFDTHVWLDLSALVTDPAPLLGGSAAGLAIAEAVHGPTAPYAIALGDLLTVVGEVSVYRSRHGTPRLGFASWTPLASSLMYIRRTSGGVRLDHVPRHLVTRLHMVDVDGDHVGVVDPHAFNDEVRAALGANPDFGADLTLCTVAGDAMGAPHHP